MRTFLIATAVAIASVVCSNAASACFLVGPYGNRYSCGNSVHRHGGAMFGHQQRGFQQQRRGYVYHQQRSYSYRVQRVVTQSYSCRDWVIHKGVEYTIGRRAC